MLCFNFIILLCVIAVGFYKTIFIACNMYKQNNCSDHQILAELLAHEVKVTQPPAANQQVRAKYSSGSSSDEELSTEVPAEKNDSDEEDFKIKVQ